MIEGFLDDLLDRPSKQEYWYNEYNKTISELINNRYFKRSEIKANKEKLEMAFMIVSINAAVSNKFMKGGFSYTGPDNPNTTLTLTGPVEYVDMQLKMLKKTIDSNEIN